MPAAQPQVIEQDGVHYEVYQQDPFNTIARQIDGYEAEKTPDDNEFTLVSTNEYVDGDYRYVDKLFRYDNKTRMQDTWWEGWHEVYYEPDTMESMHLATMRVKGHFFWSESQNYVIVDEDSVEYGTTKLIDQKYPVITPHAPVCKSNQGGSWGGSKYAQIEYRVDFEKSKGFYNTHTMKLIVNVKGEAEIKDTIS